MAKLNFTAPTYATNNNQTQPDEPSLSASAFKLLLDQVGIDTKTFLVDDLITELEQATLNDSGANRIGLNTANTVEDNVADELDRIASAGSGTIPPDASITRAKLDALLKTIADNETILGSVVSQAITVSLPYTTTDKFTLEIAADITGGAITIDDGTGALALEEYDGTAITSLDAGFYDVVRKAGEYVLMSGGGFDELKYTTKSVVNTVTNPGDIRAASGVSVLSVSAPGYLDSALAVSNVGNGQIKVLINGVEYEYREGNATSGIMGQGYPVYGSYTSYNPYVDIGSLSEQVRFTNESSSADVRRASNKIPFNTLEVIVGEDSASSATVYYTIDYALKV